MNKKRDIKSADNKNKWMIKKKKKTRQGKMKTKKKEDLG